MTLNKYKEILRHPLYNQLVCLHCDSCIAQKLVTSSHPVLMGISINRMLKLKRITL